MYFPVYVDLTQKNILIVGGGAIAARRARTLISFAEKITVIAPEICKELNGLADSDGPRIRLVWRRFAWADLSGRELVLAATDDADLNVQIGEECRRRGIPVNVCNDQSLCDFQFPSIVVDGEVVIGINASGRDHARVKETRKKLETFLQISEEEKRYL